MSAPADTKAPERVIKLACFEARPGCTLSDSARAAVEYMDRTPQRCLVWHNELAVEARPGDDVDSIWARWMDAHRGRRREATP